MTDRKNEEIAAFRFGVIHAFVTGARLNAEEKRRLLLERCERKWHIPHSPRTRISANTIYRWIRRYRNGSGKIQALYPIPRNDSGKYRKLDNETVCAIVAARKQHPDLPVPMMLEDLKQRCLVPRSVGLTTIYRLLHKNGLMQVSQAVEDRRKYEAAQPNDIWQSDVRNRNN